MPEPTFRFRTPLFDGLIHSRPNRFIMEVEVDGVSRRCHCPTTGRIGDIRFHDVPCMVERSEDDSRRTWGTVQAVSLDPVGSTSPSWVGINQGGANDYVAFFIESGQMERMVGSPVKVRREVRFGGSRIDFLLDDRLLLEVKTPLHMLFPRGRLAHLSSERFTSFERMMRHFTEIADHVPEGKRGIVLLCHLYDAEPFKVPKAESSLAEGMKEAVRNATEKGVENWQVNLRMDRNGVELLDYFKLDLFDEGA